MTSNRKLGEMNFRAALAATIVGIGIATIVALSIFCILITEQSSRAEMARLVITSVFSLFGTWIGTVLAFYFARENFEAATESTLRLTNRLEVDTPVIDVMIRRSDIVALTVPAGEDPQTVLLSEIADLMDSADKRRIPLLVDGRIVFILHRSLLDAFARHEGRAEFTNETIDDLSAIPEFHVLARAFGIVHADATLGNARDAMQSVSECNDVFVTKTGKADERVLGWLTNTLLATID